MSNHKTNTASLEVPMSVFEKCKNDPVYFYELILKRKLTENEVKLVNSGDDLLKSLDLDTNALTDPELNSRILDTTRPQFYYAEEICDDKPIADIDFKEARKELELITGKDGLAQNLISVTKNAPYTERPLESKPITRLFYGTLGGVSAYNTDINQELLDLLRNRVELESIPGQVVDHTERLTCGSSYEERTDFITRDVVCYSRDIYFDLELGDVDLGDKVAILAIRSKTSIRTTKDGYLETYPTEILGIDINLYNEDNRPDK